MRSSRIRMTNPQDDACGVRWDAHVGKQRSGCGHFLLIAALLGSLKSSVKPLEILA